MDRDVDYRAHPELYRVGRGEQGVLTVEPYKSEILPLWRFATPDAARISADAIWGLFRRYGEAGDFVGMDMARKFLQMGMTRATRYARHRTGRKYQAGTRDEMPPDPDPVKAESAAVFREMWIKAKADPHYLALKRQHQALPTRPASSAEAAPTSAKKS